MMDHPEKNQIQKKKEKHRLRDEAAAPALGTVVESPTGVSAGTEVA